MHILVHFTMGFEYMDIAPYPKSHDYALPWPFQINDLIYLKWPLDDLWPVEWHVPLVVCCALVPQIWWSCFMVHLFFNVFDNFLRTFTWPSTLTLVSMCSLVSLLWNKKKSSKSLGYIIRKLHYKIYRCVPGGAGGWGAGGWGAHIVTHKIVKKCVTFNALQLKKYTCWSSQVAHK